MNRAEALAPRLTRYIPHVPTVRQQVALLPSFKELLYGGAAGGGKSDYLLMAALQYADLPGYSALLLRRTYPMLKQSGGLLPRAQEWLEDTDAKGAESADGYPTRYDFPSGGVLSFGHMQNERDKFNYQGGEYQYIGFDELTQFSQSQFRYLFSRLRRLEGSSLPPRMRAASNPGGVGHDWVKARFPVNGNRQADGPIFVPARLDDNPHLDRAQYVESLNELDPVTLQQLLNGDWTARQAGGMFKREWFPVVDACPADVRVRLRAWDLAATEEKPGTDPDWTVGVRLSVTRNGLYTVEDVRRVRATPAGVERLIQQTCAIDGRDVPVWIEQEPGSSGKIAISGFVKALAGYNVRGQPSTGKKPTRAAPFSSQAEAGNVRLMHGPWLSDYLDELEAFGPNCSHDDQVDATSLAFSKVLSTTATWSDLYGTNADDGEAAAA